MVAVSLNDVAALVRAVTYLAVGMLALFNAHMHKGIMQVYRKSIGVLFVALAVAAVWRVFHPESIDLLLSIMLTPLIFWILIMEIIFRVNDARGQAHYRRKDD